MAYLVNFTEVKNTGNKSSTRKEIVLDGLPVEITYYTFEKRFFIPFTATKFKWYTGDTYTLKGMCGIPDTEKYAYISVMVSSMKKYTNEDVLNLIELGNKTNTGLKVPLRFEAEKKENKWNVLHYLDY